jgi:hypothetical protein
MEYLEACLRSSATSDGGILALEGMGTNILLLLKSGRNHPDYGTQGVQLYLYTICILHPVSCIEYTVYYVQHTGYIYDTGYSNNLQ